MFRFSSLDYLLTKAATVIHEIPSNEPLIDLLLTASNFTHKISQIVSSENSTINNTSYSNSLYYLLGTGKISSETEINKSSVLSTIEKWEKLISSPPTTLNTYLGTGEIYASESGLQYCNETYPDAAHLDESWWNIFDARYMKHGWGWTITLIVAYMFILVAGVIGNVMVILVVLMRPQMRSVTNWFIMNLAVADFFVIVFCVPSTLLANIFYPWILGSFMCKAVAYVQGVSGCASAYSLAAISLDRCQAIFRNCERPRGFSQTTCVSAVFIIWTVAISLTIPWAVVFEVTVSEYDGLHYCMETWEIEKHGNIYFLLVNVACFYAIPLLLIFVSNWIIYCHVTHRDVPEDSVSSAPIRKMHRKTRHHVLKMLGIVTLTFLFCWLPVYILVTVIKFSENISESENSVLEILMPIAQWLGSGNSCINPILYAFLNKKFRRMCKSILPSWFQVKAVGKHVRTHKTPLFIANVNTRTCPTESKPADRFDNQHLINHSKFHNQTITLISGLDELTGKVVATALQTTSSNTSSSVVFSSFSQKSAHDVFDARQTSAKTISDL